MDYTTQMDAESQGIITPEMEKVAGLYDVANEKDAEPVYTMVDGLPVLELKEAV